MEGPRLAYTSGDRTPLRSSIPIDAQEPTMPVLVSNLRDAMTGYESGGSRPLSNAACERLETFARKALPPGMFTDEVYATIWN